MMNRKSRTFVACHRQEAGLTLIELLIVISVIAILFALLFPAFSKVRDGARRRQASVERRIIGQAIEAYRLKNRRLPAPEPLQGGSDTTFGTDSNPNGLVMRLLREADPPFLDASKLRWDGAGPEANVLNPWDDQYRIWLNLSYTQQGRGYSVE